MIKEVPPVEWDEFVESSEQGTIFSTTRWLDLWPDPYKLYGYYKGNNLLGGICGLERHGFDSGYELTPFQGILVTPMPNAKYPAIMARHMEVADALKDFLYLKYRPVVIFNHYTFPDIRTFLWRKWCPYIRYTYLVTPESELEKDTRYLVNKEGKECSLVVMNNPKAFAELYDETFKRKGMATPFTKEFIIKVITEMKGKQYFVTREGEIIAAAVFIKDSKRSYYLLGASKGDGGSSLCVYEAIKDNPGEVDLGGCNDEKIGLFKRGFGGQLMPYFEVVSP